MPELLSALDAFRREFNNSRKDPSALIVIGHSLGGTIVFEALASIFKARLAEVWPGVDIDGTSRVVSGFGDLVLLVNPAIEAERWHSIHDLAETYASFSKHQRPLLVVASSETDSATNTWFPVGQWFGTLFEKTRDREQRQTLITAIGNYPPFVTHHLSRGDLPPGDKTLVEGDLHVHRCICEMPDFLSAPEVGYTLPQASEQRDEGWGAQPCTAQQHIGPLLLTCDPRVQKGNPFWVVRVSPNVLHEHNGFFNPYFLLFVRRLVLGGLE